VALRPAVKERVAKALRLLVDDPRHPSLRLKKMQGSGGIWEVRVDLHHRVTLEIGEGYYLLRNVGKHDETLDRP